MKEKTWGRSPPFRKTGQKSMIAVLSFMIGIKSILLHSICILGIGILILHLCRYSCFAVLSGSMEPEIQTGSLVLVHSGNTVYKERDIIAFRVDNTTVTHRILKQDQDKFITGGDANACPDHWRITKEQIIGKVCITLPYCGYFLVYIKSKRGIGMLIILYLMKQFEVFLKKEITK